PENGLQEQAKEKQVGDHPQGGDDQLAFESKSEQDREHGIHCQEYRRQQQISVRERDVRVHGALSEPPSILPSVIRNSRFATRSACRRSCVTSSPALPSPQHSWMTSSTSLVA